MPADREEGESDARPILKELNQTYLMLGGANVRSPEIEDNYAKMVRNLDPQVQETISRGTRCAMTSAPAWRRKKEYYRVMYEIYGIVCHLGRYNFDTQDFPFIEKSALVNVGSMSLLARSGDNALPPCGSEKMIFFSRMISFSTCRSP